MMRGKGWEGYIAVWVRAKVSVDVLVVTYQCCLKRSSSVYDRVWKDEGVGRFCMFLVRLNVLPWCAI
jgi:hypothetical protein